jgi:hypothetical protein
VRESVSLPVRPNTNHQDRSINHDHLHHQHLGELSWLESVEVAAGIAARDEIVAKEREIVGTRNVCCPSDPGATTPPNARAPPRNARIRPPSAPRTLRDRSPADPDFSNIGAVHASRNFPAPVWKIGVGPGWCLGAAEGPQAPRSGSGRVGGPVRNCLRQVYLPPSGCATHFITVSDAPHQLSYSDFRVWRQTF